MLRFPERFELVVVAPEQVTTPWLRSLEEDGWDVAPPDAAVSGELVWTGLPAGRYELRAGTDSGGSMFVDVPAGGPVRFAPMPYRCYRLSWVEDDSAAHAAGLREGDVVIGIDDKEFVDYRQMDAVRAAAVVRGDVVLRILRDGDALALPCNMRELWLDREMDGALWEAARRP